MEPATHNIGKLASRLQYSSYQEFRLALWVSKKEETTLNRALAAGAEGTGSKGPVLVGFLAIGDPQSRAKKRLGTLDTNRTV